MTTTVLNTVMQIHEDLLGKFHNFIESYHASSEEFRMKTFTELSGEFGKILEFEWNEVFPLLDTSDKIATLRTGAVEKRNELARVYELLIMIHVNEPDDLFHRRLVEVHGLFKDYHQSMKEMVSSPSLVFDESRLRLLTEKFNKLFYAPAV